MTTWGALSHDLLPVLLQQFVRLIGIHATMQIVQLRGGVRLYIPETPLPDHFLAKTIGFDNMALLCKHYPKETFVIDKADAALRAVRNHKIYHEYGPKSTSQLAREHDLTERQIWVIMQKMSAKKPSTVNQNTLFT